MFKDTRLERVIKVVDSDIEGFTDLLNVLQDNEVEQLGEKVEDVEIKIIKSKIATMKNIRALLWKANVEGDANDFEARLTPAEKSIFYFVVRLIMFFRKVRKWFSGLFSKIRKQFKKSN